MPQNVVEIIRSPERFVALGCIAFVVVYLGFQFLRALWNLIASPIRRQRKKKQAEAGYRYEEKVAKYLKKNGYWRVKVTQASRDLGVDITCRKGLFKKYAVQCKRYSTPVGVQAVQEVVAGKKMYRCNSAMVITNSRFTKAAELLAQKNKVKLIAEIKG